MRILTGVSLAVIIVSSNLLLVGCQNNPPGRNLGPGGATASISDVSLTEGGSGRTAAAGDAGSPEGMLRLAADLEGRGENGTALSFYERAAAASKGDVATYIKVGDALLRLDYPVNAASAYSFVLTKEPENGRALLGLGSALARNGDTTQALTYLVKAAPLVKTASAYQRLGLVYVLAGQPREALASFEQAHAMDAEDIDITTNLALAASLALQHEKAIGLMKAVAKRPDVGPQYKRNLVLVMGIAGKDAEAKASVKDLPPETVATLLEQASRIRGLPSARERALALGTASSTTQ